MRHRASDQSNSFLTHWFDSHGFLPTTPTRSRAPERRMPCIISRASHSMPAMNVAAIHTTSQPKNSGIRMMCQGRRLTGAQYCSGSKLSEVFSATSSTMSTLRAVYDLTREKQPFLIVVAIVPHGGDVLHEIGCPRAIKVRRG